jgi:hypothetical protein
VQNSIVLHQDADADEATATYPAQNPGPSFCLRSAPLPRSQLFSTLGRVPKARIGLSSPDYLLGCRGRVELPLFSRRTPIAGIRRTALVVRRFGKSRSRCSAFSEKIKWSVV